MARHLVILAGALVASMPAARADGLRGEIQLDDSISPSGANHSSDPALASTGYTVHVAWSETAVAPATAADVYYRRSEDGGKSWSAPVNLSQDGAVDDTKTQVATDGSLVVVAWLHGDALSPQDIRGVVSTDGGVTFGPILDLSGTLSGDAGDADSLRLKASGAHVYVIFEDDVANPALTEDIYVAASTDYGATFSNPVRVNDSPAGTVDCDEPELDTVNGTAYLVWIDKRSGNDRVYFSRTTDGGVTWSTDKRLDRSGTLANTGAPSMDAEGSNVHIAWIDDRNNLGVADEVFYVSSADGGVTFTLDRKIGSAGAGVDADEPRVAVTGVTGALVYVAWPDNRNGVSNDVFFASSTDGGATFAAEFALDPDGGAIHDLGVRMHTDGDTVAVTYREETFAPPLHQLWLGISHDRGSAGSFERMQLSTGLGAAGDVDDDDLTVTEARDVLAAWGDDRAGGLNNDVYLNGQRFPELTVVPNGNKVAFHLSDAGPAEEGQLFLAAFSLTGTDSFELSPDLNLCLTVDSFTLLLIQPWALPLVTDTVTGGAASTLELPFKNFSGFATGLVFDPVTLEFLAATDPVEFN